MKKGRSTISTFLNIKNKKLNHTRGAIRVGPASMASTSINRPTTSMARTTTAPHNIAKWVKIKTIGMIS